MLFNVVDNQEQRKCCPTALLHPIFPEQGIMFGRVYNQLQAKREHYAKQAGVDAVNFLVLHDI